MTIVNAPSGGTATKSVREIEIERLLAQIADEVELTPNSWQPLNGASWLAEC